MGINDYYEHGIARGIVRFAKQREQWQLFGYGWMFGQVEDLAGWRGDGIITRAESSADARLLASLKLPVVDVAGAYTESGFHQVQNDDYQTGKKAGAYLRNCGFTNFGYCGVSDVQWSEKRKEGFFEGAELKQTSPVFERSLSWWENLQNSPEDSGSGSLNRWLSDLTRPAAVFACNDTAGVKITGLCRGQNISVPEGIAVIGVDNDDILCELANPSLSSIQLNCEEIGYRAAELLDTLIRRSKQSKKWVSEVLIPPREIIERDTSRIFVCQDPAVQKAVNFIRGHSIEGIQVGDVINHVHTSRRSLEMKFRKYLGNTIHYYITKAKLTYIKNQLVSTEKTMEAISRESGFQSLQRFHLTFKKETGLTPGGFRKKNRRG